MPELVHECGKTVRFPSGTEGRRGKCPHCGGSVVVPDSEAGEQIKLDPPPHWEGYQAYLEDRGPPPEHMVMPSRLMLQTEAEERWERRSEVVWSKFSCPACKERITVDQVICTKCGLDFRTGLVLGKPNVKLNAKGLEYLNGIRWVQRAREALENDEDEESAGEGRQGGTIVPPRRRKRRR